MDDQLAATPVAHDGDVVVFLRPALLLQEHRAGARAAADIDQRGDDLVGEVFEQDWVAVFAALHVVDEAHVPTAAVVGVAAGVNIHQRVDGDVVDVAQPVGVDLHLGTIRAEAHHAATEHGQLCAVGALGAVYSEIADGNVYPAVDAHADAVGGVIGTAFLVV